MSKHFNVVGRRIEEVEQMPHILIREAERMSSDCGECGPDTCAGCKDSPSMIRCSTCRDGGQGSGGGTGNCQDPDTVMEADCHNGSCGSCAGSTNCQDAVHVSGCATRSKKLTLSEAERYAIGISIEAYTFGQVRYRLMTEKVIPETLVDTAIAEFKKYLMVVVNSEGSVAMVNPIIDEVWHAFILHTKDYAEFTTEVMGWYLHHEPNTPATPSSPDSVENFLNGYNALFGELHPIWNMRLA